MPERRMRFAIALAALTVDVGAVAPARAENAVKVEADFSVGADYPLSKTKFAVYNSGWVPLEHYERDAPLFEEVQPYALRIDLGWGTSKWRRQGEPVGGTADALQYEFGEMDRLATLLNGRGIRPYWAYSYIPPPFQAIPGKPNGTTTQPARWGEALGTFAERATTSPSLRIGFQEIYNEPDNRDFFRGSVEDYIDLYRAGVNGIRAADADAVVGGPAIAFTDAWVAPFLDAVTRERLPLDFFSFHYYPTVPYASPDVAGVIRDMRRALAARPELVTAEMHLNEYNSYRIDYPEGGRQDRYALASAMLHDYAFLLTQPDVTQVNWAQFQDTGGGNWSGMISLAGHRKATFNAYHLYQQMPVDRHRVTIDGPPEVEALASSDERRAALLLWNKMDATQQSRVTFGGIRFPKANLRVLRIDAEHGSWGDNPKNERLVPVEMRSSIGTRDFTWSGEVPKHGVVYIELTDASPGATETPPPFGGTFVRALRFFPNRASTSYSDFDERTWTTRMGMGRETQAHEQVAAVVEDWPRELEARVVVDGQLAKLDANSCLGLRLDYVTAEGYAWSVIFHGPSGAAPDLYDPARDAMIPWGTRRAPDQAVAVVDLSRFVLTPADYAPAGWTGRAQASFIMQNTGPGTRSKFQLLPTRR